MGRAPCCDEKVALKKGPWTPDEDQKLVAYIQENGHGSWRSLPEKAGLARCGKSCRLRWTNYLRPDIKRGRFSNEEDNMIIQLHAILGNRWSAIASHLPRRTDNEIKNYWNTHLKKRLAQMGIDPVTHKTSSSGLNLSPAWTPLVSTQLTHTKQWHCALAEAEARLSKSQSPSLQTELQCSTSVVPHPSALFMRSWKTKVEDTLKPKFGTVKLESPRVRVDCSSLVSNSVGWPQKILSDWNTALGIQTSSSVFLEKLLGSPLEKQPAMAMKNEPNLLVDMFTEMSASERFGDPFTSSFPTNEVRVGLENHFSPTSILSGPDSDSCSGSGDSDCFEFLHYGSGSYHSFPLIDGEYEHAQSASVRLDIPESFWQAGQQATFMQARENLLEDFKNTSETGCSELIIPLEFTNGSEQFDPEF